MDGGFVRRVAAILSIVFTSILLLAAEMHPWGREGRALPRVAKSGPAVAARTAPCVASVRFGREAHRSLDVHAVDIARIWVVGNIAEDEAGAPDSKRALSSRAEVRRGEVKRIGQDVHWNRTPFGSLRSLENPSSSRTDCASPPARASASDAAVPSAVAPSIHRMRAPDRPARETRPLEVFRVMGPLSLSPVGTWASCRS